MKSTSESLSHPETSNGRAAEGSCVVARRGGEQPEADLRSHKEQGRLVPSPAAKSIPVSNTRLFISASTFGKAASALRNEDHASPSRSLAILITGVSNSHAATEPSCSVAL